MGDICSPLGWIQLGAGGCRVAGPGAVPEWSCGLGLGVAVTLKGSLDVKQQKIIDYA